MALALLVVLAPSIALGAVTIARTSAPEFYIDVGDNLYCQYVSYAIENIGPSPYEEVWVELREEISEPLPTDAEEPC